jgi:hypothetical protein
MPYNPGVTQMIYYAASRGELLVIHYIKQTNIEEVDREATPISLRINTRPNSGNYGEYRLYYYDWKRGWIRGPYLNSIVNMSLTGIIRPDLPPGMHGPIEILDQIAEDGSVIGGAVPPMIR